MYTSSSRKNIHKIVKVKVFLQSYSDYLNCHNQKLPALHTDCFTLTAVSDIVIVIHIEIENQLSFLSSAWRVFFWYFTPYGTGIDFDWYLFKSGGHSFPHGIGIVKDNISLHSITLILEGKFSMIERSCSIISKPFFNSLIWIQVLVVEI
jgi:hypothetical protein